jgi:chromosome segregation ATPase
MPQMQRPYEPPDGGATTETVDPSERLRQLQAELEHQELRLTHVGKQRDELKVDIADLSKNVDDVKATLTSYGAEVQQLEATLHGLQYFYDQKTKMVMAAIGEKKEPIDLTIREYDHETGQLRERLQELATMLRAAQGESEKADAIQAQKQRDYDHVKAYKTKTEDQLKQLDALRGDITTADDATDVASMYFLVLEFKHVLEHTRIVSQHHLAQQLKEELSELEAAKEAARARKAAADDLTAEYTSHQQALASRVADRRQKLLDVIHTLYPVQADLKSHE